MKIAVLNIQDQVTGELRRDARRKMSTVNTTMDIYPAQSHGLGLVKLLLTEELDLEEF